MKLKHPEAFRIMPYKCPKCGFVEYIWNSRDGVTPFSIKCIKKGCDSLADHVFPHVMNKDEKFTRLAPRNIDRYFVTMSWRQARSIAKDRIQNAVEYGYLDPQIDYMETIEKLTESIYGEGHAPCIIPAEQYKSTVH